ncbi:MAG: hypothetical protein DMG22_06530 [Acidobacteria bacterium]|nr:MAG: hypothetical protein DMG22_06530 [Acidobacteriota bacterium]
MQIHNLAGDGVICETRALPGAVIPAKAGIYCASHWKCAAEGMDSRFRGNDRSLEGDPIPNDTTTTWSRRGAICVFKGVAGDSGSTPL